MTSTTKTIQTTRFDTHPMFETIDKDLFDKYQNVLYEKFSGLASLNVLKEYQGTIKGSNTYSTILINSLLPKGKHVATPTDLENIILKDNRVLRRSYTDTGIIIRSQDEPNYYLAQDLALQIKTKETIRFPMIIPLRYLNIRLDKNTSSGLAFTLKDDARAISSDMMNKTGFFNNKDKTYPIKDGFLPKLLHNEYSQENDRELTINNKGLSRLYMNQYLDLVSDLVDLRTSYDAGKTIIINEKKKKKIITFK